MPVLTHEHEVSMRRARLLVLHYMAMRQSVMLWGTYGIGKTDMVYQIGAETKRKVVLLHVNLREPVDFRGIPVNDPETKTTIWFVPDELPQVERDGEKGILYLDEINTGSAQTLAIVAQLILEKKVGDYVLPEGWVIIAAGNRVTDKAAAIRMPTHLRNRFAHIYCKPELDAWCAWANTHDIAPELIAFLRLKDDYLHVPFKGDENATPTPRSWVAASMHINAPADIRMQLMAGLVGDMYAAEFDGFIQLYHTIGSLDDIIAHPDTAKVVIEPSIRFATCTGLGRRANRKNFDAIVKYAKRLNRESEFLVVTDATTRDESLKNTSTYGAWAVANQDLLVQAS